MNRTILNLLIFSLINLIILPRSIATPIAESQPSNQKTPPKFQQPAPPPDAPKVGRGQGGASRGICRVSNTISVNIIPLLPANGWGLTASESPTLWMYVSYSDRWEGEASPIAELSVENRQTDTKLKPKTYSVELPKTSGIFSINLPQSLESEQWYRWYLVTDCQTAASSMNDVLQIEGFLQRQEVTNLIPDSKLLSVAERVDFYTEKHLWYDALNEAILLYCQKSHDRSDNEIENYWQTLLKSDAVNLENIGDRRVFCPDRL